MRDFNFIITTNKDITSTSNLQESGWISVNVSEYQLSSDNGKNFGSTGTGTTSASVENIALAQILPSETFSNFSSDFSFDEFCMQTLSNTAFVFSSYFPSNTYGINTDKMPSDISESNTLTYVEKKALILAISLRDAGHYVIANPEKWQISYKFFLEKYNIYTSTSTSIC